MFGCVFCTIPQTFVDQFVDVSLDPLHAVHHEKNPSIHPDRRIRSLIRMVSLHVSRGRICDDDDAVHRGVVLPKSWAVEAINRERAVDVLFFSRTKTSTKRNQSRKNDPFKDQEWGVDPN